MFKDFRDYLDYLEKNGELQRVKKEVDVRFEIAAGIRKTSDTDGPALLFENIKRFPGWRVAGGVYATQKLTALAVGLPVEADEDSIVRRYIECHEKRVKPKLIATGPVKEVIIKGEDVDLSKLPVPIYSELDSGPYLTAGVEIEKNPKTGIQNLGIHRREIQGKNLTGVAAPEYDGLGVLVRTAENRGEGLAIATAIGVDPSVIIASQLKSPLGVEIDETEVAGAFRGAPIEMVKCETIDVEVPANAEIVIEGRIIPGKREFDGPFGEYPGNYITLTGSAQAVSFPVIKVTCITMRRNPIFHAMLTGMPVTENHTLKKWSFAAAAYEDARQVADVKAINFTWGGTAAYHVVVAIRKRDEMEPKNLIRALTSDSARVPAVSYVIVVDDDINVYDPVDVELALATRMQADEDVIVIPPRELPIPGKPRLSLGPTKAKLGIDATAPLKDKRWYSKIRVPGVEEVSYV